MRSRGSHLRTKVVALLGSLALLWLFAAWVTLRDGLNLLWVETYNSKIYQPSEPLLEHLQVERRMSVVYLGDPGAKPPAALVTTRQETEQLAAAFRESAHNWRAELAASPELERRIDELNAGLDGLRGLRQSIDQSSVGRAAVNDAYTKVIESIFRVYDALGQLDDQEIADDTTTLIDLNRAREVISQEDALIAGVLAKRRVSSEEYARFVQLVAVQRFVAAEAAANLPAADRARYDQMVAGEKFSHFRSLEDDIAAHHMSEGRPPVKAAEWEEATRSAMAELKNVVLTGGSGVVERSSVVAAGVIIRMVLAAGLGLFAVIASIIVSITTARALLEQLERLRDAARQLANERLPSVVARIGSGEEVDIAAEAPPLAFGTDEIGQVGQAFNVVQETAIRTAVEQAELRRSVRDVFLSLARRTQALVHRQLTLLDGMERREHDAEKLEDLFRVDHLATRMRRNAENLIVLSGAAPGRAWRRSVPMIDVIRGAVAEVEDYARVTVLPIASVNLAGRAVSDIIHLIAELVENALSFSPPHTGVQISGQPVANGFVIEIEDRGLGMSEEELAAVNAQIVSQQEFRLTSAARLGMFVVSRLTQRHGVRVQLKGSPYGGTTAVVLVPSALITEDGVEDNAALPARWTANTNGMPSGRNEENTSASAGSRAVAVADRPQMSPPPLGGPADTRGPAPVDTRGPAPADMGGRSAIDAVGTASVSQREPTMVEQERPSASPLAERRPVRQPQPEPRLVDPAPALEPTDTSEFMGATALKPGDPDTGNAPQGGALTPSGLPVRVRQASLAAPLKEGTPGVPAGAEDDDPARSPDQVRRMMSSYQSGTLRGRTEAAHLRDGQDMRPPPSSTDQ